jgi:hypothetical protein
MYPRRPRSTAIHSFLLCSARRFAVIGALTLVVMPLTSETAHASPSRTLLPPTTMKGEVRQIHLRRVEKALSDTLAFSGAITVLSEPTPVEDKSQKLKVNVAASDPRIARADLHRQQGTDLAAEGKHRAASSELQNSIGLYVAAYAELVDYTKLADAYARAGVSAYAAGKKSAVAGFFDDGLRLQPTLTIDRRAADKGLLALFDARRAEAESGAKASIVVSGEAAGAIAYVDGVRIGELPATCGGLARGDHFVQVRGDGWHAYAKRVHIRSKDVAVKAKLKAVKVADPTGPSASLAFSDLAPCIEGGNMPGKICKQTAAEFVLYSVLVADRYGRLALHAFLQRSDGKVVVVPLRELDKNLSDVAAQITELSKDVGQMVTEFPVDRALTRAPKLFK